MNAVEGRLAVLIERTAELKRGLVEFACSPRLERSLAAAMVEAGLEELDEADAIGTIDRFALRENERSWSSTRMTGDARARR